MPSTARGLTLSNLLSLDIIASSVANGWDRPIYFASTVPEDYYMGLNPYLRSTGMAYEVTPLYENSEQGRQGVNTEKMYRNVTEKFQWGGLDKASGPEGIYLDETVRRMVSSTRNQLADLVTHLYAEGYTLADSASTPQDKAKSADKYKKAVTVLNLMEEKLPASIVPYSVHMGGQVAQLYIELGKETGDKKLEEKGRNLLKTEIERYASNIRYYQSLKPWQYSTLQYIDQYIYGYYFMDLLQRYLEAGGDADALMKSPELAGINYERLQSRQMR